MQHPITTKAKFAVLTSTGPFFVTVDMRDPKSSITNDLSNVILDAIQMGFNPLTQHFIYADWYGEFTLVKLPKHAQDAFDFHHLHTHDLREACQLAQRCI